MTSAEFRFVKAKDLAGRLDIDEQAVRKRISDTRRLLAPHYLAHFNVRPTGNELIETKGWAGYRLSPSLAEATLEG